MDETTFTLPSLPDITFNAKRGGVSGMPSNWVTITASAAGTPVPNFSVGFQGP